MTYLVSYGCSTAAGDGGDALWQGLSTTAPKGDFLWNDHPSGQGKVKDYLVKKLLGCWEDCLAGVTESEARRTLSSLGVIFASTKGCLEDYIWQDTLDLPSGYDPIYPVLKSFLDETNIAPKKSICISNACSSSHSAICLAKKWLDKGVVENVLILSVDFIGPFISKGFSSLKAISADHPKPFSENRDGLQLGDGAAVLLLSGKHNPKNLKISGVSLVAIGKNVTRPNSEACTQALRAAITSSSVTEIPDLIIAHGTATAANDSAEDGAFRELFGPETPPITATKWRVGHTMAVSGAIDLIAAAESIKRQKSFSINQSEVDDPSFSANYLRPGSKTFPERIESVLVNSMGFGGIHSSILIEQTPCNSTTINRTQTDKPTPRLFGKVYVHQPTFKLDDQPEWSHLVKRWYQLDLAARSLVESYYYWSNLNPVYTTLMSEIPAFVLASSEASNATDINFVGDGGTSPSLFTHTLPNIRAAALFEAMNWQGPLFCFQFGSETLSHGLIEACNYKHCSAHSSVSFTGIRPNKDPKSLETKNYSVMQVILTEETELLRHHVGSSSVTIFNEKTAIPYRKENPDDAMLSNWLQAHESGCNKLYLGDNFWIERDSE